METKSSSKSVADSIDSIEIDSLDLEKQEKTEEFLQNDAEAEYSDLSDLFDNEAFSNIKQCDLEIYEAAADLLSQLEDNDDWMGDFVSNIVKDVKSETLGVLHASEASNLPAEESPAKRFKSERSREKIHCISCATSSLSAGILYFKQDGELVPVTSEEARQKNLRVYCSKCRTILIKSL